MKRLLSYPELKPKGIPFSKPHLKRLEDAGKFPLRIHLSPLVVAWDEREVDAYIEACTRSRDADAAAASARVQKPSIAAAEKRRVAEAASA